MPRRPSKKALLHYQKQISQQLQQADRRSELLYRKLRGEILSENEIQELDSLTEILERYLVRPETMDAETRHAMEQIRELRNKASKG